MHESVSIKSVLREDSAPPERAPTSSANQRHRRAEILLPDCIDTKTTQTVNRWKIFRNVSFARTLPRRDSWGTLHAPPNAPI